jgi:putative ABC transport system ATP-binding protein
MMGGSEVHITSGGAPILRTQSVSRVFTVGGQEVHALRGVSLEVPERSLTILRGRSGSGKTTLINLMGALDRPTNGRVFFRDREVSAMTDAQREAARRREMGFVFQSIALIALMSAFENVDFRLRVAGIPADHRAARVEECLTFVGLAPRMDHRPNELSGGEQQRVAIARAVAHRPAIVFADEPTAELDTRTGLLVVRLFRDLVEKEGLTVVMTTHDPGMMEVADRLYTLEDGELVDG